MYFWRSKSTPDSLNAFNEFRRKPSLGAPDYSLHMWPFEPTKESLCFLKGQLEWMTEAKDVNVSYGIFKGRDNFAKRGNQVTKKLLVDDKITACVKQACLLGVIFYKVSNRKTLSGETFCFLEKRLLPIFKFVLSLTYCFFYEMLIGSQTTFLECKCIVIFFFNPIVQLCLTLFRLGGGFSNPPPANSW